MTIASASGGATLRRSLLVSFTLPTLVLGLTHGPEGQIQGIYAKHAGLALTALAAATLLSKIFDAVTYPLIGYLSDQTFSHRGTRKGWVIAGAAVSVLGLWKLMRPASGITSLYFGAWMATTYLGWKLMEIPLQAWSYGLSEDYAQRSRIQSWRGLAAIVGQLLFFCIPALAVQLGFSDSTELDFRSLGVSAVVCGVALPLATLVMVLRVPEGGAAPLVVKARPALADIVEAIRRNPPLLRLLIAFLPVNLLGGMMGGVAYLYVDSYLGLSKQFPAIMALALLSAVAGIPFWSWLATRFERHRVWSVSLATGGAACGGFALLTPGPLAAPGAFVLYPLVLFTLSGAVLVFTMSADIVDYGKLTTGEDHAGLYGSIFSFAQKSLLGVSAAAGLALAGFFGADAAAATQSAGGVIGIKLSGALAPAFGLFLSAYLIRSYPLTRGRIAEIQAELQLIQQKKSEFLAAPESR